MNPTTQHTLQIVQATMEAIRPANVAYPCLSAMWPVRIATTQHAVPTSSHCHHFMPDGVIIAFQGLTSMFYSIGNARATGSANYPKLRIHAINHAREGDDFANVFGAANPCDRALEAHSEAGMRHAAVAAQIEIPLERFFRQFVFAQSLQEQVVIVDALAAPDDFAVAFRRDHVKGEGELGTLGVRLHVKGFDRSRVVVDQHRAIEGAGDDGFFVAGEVVAELR